MPTGPAVLAAVTEVIAGEFFPLPQRSPADPAPAVPDPRPSLTAQVRSLVLVARRGYPHRDERALTMAPERFAQLDPPDELIEAPPRPTTPPAAPPWPALGRV